MRRPRRADAAALAAALTVLAAAAAPCAQADWLVLRDGSRVETRGAWKEKGRLLVFHTADGTLASLRAAEVDLAASREATAEAERQATAATAAAPPGAAEPEPERPPARRITNADIPPGSPRPVPPPAEEATGAEAAAGASRAAARSGAASAVAVSTWERASQPGESLAFRGTLRNTSERTTAAAVGLQVTLTGRDGDPLAARPATVHPSTLPAGATATFEVTFDGVYDYGTLRFEIDSVALRQGDGTAGGDVAADGEPDDGGS